MAETTVDVVPAVRHQIGRPPPEPVRNLAVRPARTALLTDFDGTLAPIVADPDGVWALPGVADLLARLADKFHRVGIVSGRPASFLIDRLRNATDGHLPNGLALAGLYGMEVVEGERVVVHPDALGWVPEVDRVVALAEAGAPPGVGIERKGLSVTLHIRNAPHEAHWAEHFARANAVDSGLVVHPGRMSWELRPPVAVDKGTTIDEMVADVGAACFLGDDVGDLPAFDALDRFEANGGRAVRIGVLSDESPADLVSRADVLVEGPEGAVDLLRWLAQDRGRDAAAT